MCREDGSIPWEMRECRLPVPPCMTLATICDALVVGLEGREDVAFVRVVLRADPAGAELFFLPRPPAADVSMSRSPSLSTLMGPPERRFAIPPRVAAFPEPAPRALLRGAPFRGPVGAIAQSCVGNDGIPEEMGSNRGW